MSLDQERSRLLRELERMGVGLPAGGSERTQLRLQLYFYFSSQEGVSNASDEDALINKACKVADRLMRTEVLQDEEGSAHVSYEPPPCLNHEPSWEQDDQPDGTTVTYCRKCLTGLMRRQGKSHWELFVEE